MPIDEFKDIYAELKKGVDQTNDLFINEFNEEIKEFVNSKAERGDKFILPLKWITKTIPEDEKKIKQEAEERVEKENEKVAVSAEKDKKQKQKAKSKQSKNQKKDQNQNVTEKNNNKLVVENKNNPEPPPKIYNP
jgi:hypothetical protein